MHYWALIIVMSALSSATAVAAPVDFDREVAPILATRCLECHNEADHKGKLDLSTKAAALRVKDAVIAAGDAEKSLLWEMVAGDEMPPKKPLSAGEKATLKRWIDEGAKWGTLVKLDRFAYSSDEHAGTDWWSLQPVKRPALPAVKAASWPANPIDHFVLAKLEAKGLAPAPPADPRVLIRRVYFDLIGLPPTPQEIAEFVQEWEKESSEFRGSSSELKDLDRGTTRNSELGTRNSYSRLIDRLLASPHYGERWGRHWLDVARFTESQGFEYDRFRPNAWHYRDYVINAFNSDKPYDVFLQEQIAGDVMNFESPQAGVTSQGMIATALLVCGPWDQAGNSQANVTQRKITREEEMEDLVSVVGQTFLGMTINCARCHSHKFDPVTHADYYSFKAVFDGVRHGERSIATPQEQRSRAAELAALEKEIAQIQQSLSAIEQQARIKALQKSDAREDANVAAAVSPVARWTFENDARDSAGELHGELMGGAAVRGGRLVITGDKQFLRTGALKQDINVKTLEAWAYLPDLNQRGGGVLTIESSDGRTFDSITYGEREARKWIAGSNFFQRTRDLKADQESSSPSQMVHIAITYATDGTITLYRNGKRYAEPYKQHQLQTYKAGDARILIGLRHTGAGNGFFKGEIESASLYDRALSDDEIAQSFAAGAHGGPVVTAAQLIAAMTAAQRQEREAGERRVAALRQQIAALPAVTGVSYIGTRTQPPVAHRLHRGDVNSPAEVVAPAGLSIIKHPGGDFGLAPDAPEAQRRIKLAQWLAHPQHPLTARVMVNRLWHHHFGRGIVETPNDFGFSGSKPTHPELLDWLAAEFVEESFEFRVSSSESQPNAARVSSSATRNSQPATRNSSAWSIKRMHKLILLSATYRQSAAMNERAVAIDADNALLWRYAPRRIEGEIIRDAMLAVSGELNPQVGGPSFKPFTVTNHGSDFYHLKDMIGPDYNRRTIYRANINSGKSALMDALDCPDPSIKTPSRRVTTTPLAALALMNNSFVLRQAEKMSQRMTTQANQNEAKAIALAFETALGRGPTKEEAQQAGALVKEHGLETLCWALLNASEFMYVK